MTAPVFVVGCPRSGTALLRDLLRAHPSLAFPGESHFVPLMWRAYGDPESDREAVALAARILRLRWVRAWELDRDAASFARHRSYAGVVDDLLATYAARAGRPRWGDKTPQYVLDMPTLRELFPAARFVHIVRDGRDVARSLVRASFGPRNPATAGAYWRRLVATGRRDGRTLGTAYEEVRFEDLLADPERVLRRVVAFLGEAWTPEVLERAAAPLDRRRARSWRTEMAPADRRAVESVAGDLLASLGYDADEVPPRPALRRALDRADHTGRLALLRLGTRDAGFWRTEREMRVARLRAAVRSAG